MLVSIQQDVATHHAEVMERIDGGANVRREDSIRGRLHTLENERAAAKAATHALSEAQEERQRAGIDRRYAESRSRAQLWRWVMAVIATAAIIAPYVARAFG